MFLGIEIVKFMSWDVRFELSGTVFFIGFKHAI